LHSASFPLLHLWKILHKFEATLSGQINLFSMYYVYLPYKCQIMQVMGQLQYLFNLIYLFWFQLVSQNDNVIWGTTIAIHWLGKTKHQWSTLSTLGFYVIIFDATRNLELDKYLGNSGHSSQLWTKLVLDITLWIPLILWLLPTSLLLFVTCGFHWFYIMHSWPYSCMFTLYFCFLSDDACIILDALKVRNYLNTSYFLKSYLNDPMS